MQLVYFAILAGLVPLIFFAVGLKKKGLNQGVWAGCAAACFELVLVYFWLGEIDYTVVFAIFLFLTLGMISVKSKNELFFKLQPSFMFFGFAVLIFYHQFFDEPILLKYFVRYKDQLPQMLLDKLQYIPNMEKIFVNQSFGFGVSCLLSCVIMYFAATKLPMKWWLILRAIVIYVVSFPVSMIATSLAV